MGPDINAAVAEAFRRESGRVLASLVRVLGDLDAAEEALQDALVLALERWPQDGIPDRPAAWIVTTARRRAIDRLRREMRRPAVQAAAHGLLELTRQVASGEVDPLGDDQLTLIFACCHPALPLEGRVALALRSLGGLSTAEIARAFLVPEATMAQRLVRVKAKIRATRIPFRVPGPGALPERVESVLTVLYLIFNEGYAATAGDALVRRSLCAEAIRMTRVVAAHLPGHPEATGLLALMLLHDSRREARESADGTPIPLAEQDRSRWDTSQVAEGLALVEEPGDGRPPGPYRLQAAVSACHARAASAEQTDWRSIAALYGELAEHLPSPVVELNRAVAEAMAGDVDSGLRRLDLLEAGEELSRYHLLQVARADLLCRAGRTAEGAEAYRRALALTENTAERRFLSARLRAVTAAG